MTPYGQRLVMRYAPSGQFTFRHFSATASDEQLYDIAQQLNTFQDRPLDKVLRVQVYTFGRR